MDQNMISSWHSAAFIDCESLDALAWLTFVAGIVWLHFGITSTMTAEHSLSVDRVRLPPAAQACQGPAQVGGALLQANQPELDCAGLTGCR